MLRYSHTAPAPPQLPLDDVVLLTSMADEYDMPVLLSLCRAVLEEKLTMDNVLQASLEPDGVLKWTLIAQRYGFAKILSTCEHMIIRCVCDASVGFLLAHTRWQHTHNGTTH